MDDNNNILVIKEKLKDKSKFAGWKFPGGLTNLGEEFEDAAIREVYEETGVKTAFQNILTLRHSHNIQYGMSDIYVICQLKPLTTEINIDEDEIAEAKWMNLDEFKQSTTSPMFLKIISMLENKNNGLIEETVPSIVPGRKPYKLYYPKS